jgi:4'-phosphopantetheinyl transferase
LQIKELKFVKDHKTEWIVLAQTDYNKANTLHSSKYLAEYLLAQYRGISTEISYTDTGKPYLQNRAECISISHTHQWFCLMLSTSHECGIDIEHERDALHRIAPRFMNASEMNFLEHSKYPQSTLQFIWGAKEAVYKSWGKRGLEFATSMIVEPFEAKPECSMIMDFNFRQHRRKYALNALHIKDLFVVYTTGFDVLPHLFN